MTQLWVERTGIRRYTGRSTRGAEVLIGSEDDEGVFTPGELLKIALAACSGLSSDQPLRRRLVTLYVRGLPVPAALAADVARRTDGASPAFIKEFMRRIAQHHRGDGVLAGEDVEARLHHLGAKVLRVALQPVAQAPHRIRLDGHA